MTTALFVFWFMLGDVRIGPFRTVDDCLTIRAELRAVGYGSITSCWEAPLTEQPQFSHTWTPTRTPAPTPCRP